MEKFLDDGVVSLRALDPTDLDLLYIWENDTSLWDVGNSITPFSRSILWEYLQDYDGDIYKHKQVRLMVDAEGVTVGTVDLYNFDPFNNRIAIGILIASDHKGRGYGERALKLSVDYCLRFLGIHMAWAMIPSDNIASRKAFEKCGFSHTATLSQWLRRGGDYFDAEIYQFLLQ